MAPAPPALELADLHTWQGPFPALQGLNLSVASGHAVALHCDNDFLRTSLLNAVLGFADKRQGSMRIHGTEAIDLSVERIHALGVGCSRPFPDILPSLSCEENLLMPTEQGTCLGGGMSLAEIFELFPDLQERRHHPCSSLSIELQHLLALGRILRTGVNLIVLNRISAYLGPAGSRKLAHAIAQLKLQRYTLILLERIQAEPNPLVDYCYHMQACHLAPCSPDCKAA